ncbi:hypothetical protein [Euzebya sp.]|uniref:hypothetical protein n=1 Tax=Euzebya sp. TaxID=1971409 RepID=UPI00351277AB
MQVVVDSSTLISLAWAAQLSLLGRLPIEPVVIQAVYDEVVVAGRASGHADAVAIEQALVGVVPLADPDGDSVDARVVAAAAAVGIVACNDVVIGRRASNLGARWLRTADLVVLGVRLGSFDADVGRRAIAALGSSGRITPELERAYTEELG